MRNFFNYIRPDQSLYDYISAADDGVTPGDASPVSILNGAMWQQSFATTSVLPAPIVATNGQAVDAIQIDTVNTSAAVTVAADAAIEINGVSDESVTFSGTTGELTLTDSLGFTGQISGLAGADALNLIDVSYGANTTATFLGTAAGGILTVTDGTNTANIALVGDYLSSGWTLSSDGEGGTVVVDPVSTDSWQTLPVGGGGFVDGIDIAPNGEMVVRTDTSGAYLWNGTEWQNLVNATSMPTSFLKPGAGQGVYEIQIAPSNPNILYMMDNGNVYKSTNQGTTWTETSFAKVTENSNDAYRMDGQKMAVDPNNSNIVYVGTPQNGLFVTTNGGATWQSVSAVPVSHADSNGIYPGITGIEFDPALGVTGGVTNTIFAASYGNGVYESTNGGATWSAIGGPSDVVYAAVSITGVYYVTDGTSLWSYANATWTELTNGGGGIQAVAVDPTNPNEIVIQSPAGRLSVSYNGGATWIVYSYQVNSTDIPWLAGANTTKNGAAGYLTVGGLAFNPLVPNELVSSAGTGVWVANNLPTQNLGSNTPIIWNDQSAGIENLVANEIIVPPGGDPVVASWDWAFFYLDNSNAYPSTYGPVDKNQIVAGWSVDYASSDPSFLVGIADNWGAEESGYSTNGGQTWTAFATDPTGAGTNYIGGTIAASSPTNIIWAPADGEDPYYTLNGGATWTPITLPGVTSWSGFDSEYYYDTRTVTADRVLPNTFYLYYAGHGVYETTNGGSTWTQVYSGTISAYSIYNAELQSVPGEAGNLFFTGGPQSGFASEGFYKSTNQGATWTAVPNVTEVYCFGFGAPAPGESYPSIYIVGFVNNVYGIWQSNNDAQSWTQIGTYPTGDLANIKTISGDPNIFGQVYVGFSGSGYAEFTAGPMVTGVSASPANAVEFPGDTVTLTLNMSETVTVTGIPTLSLNNGGTATYTGGSGTNALTFSYTVSANSNDTSALGITQVNEPSGATINDANGNAANLAGAVTVLSGLQVDPPVTVSSVTTSGIGITNGSGDLNAGHVVTLTVNLSEAATVNGTPTLTLNDGGTATYSGGTGTKALTFSYTVAAGQNTPELTVTAVNLGTATVTDAAGNAANLSGAISNPTGTLQIDTAAPTVTSVATSGGGITNGNGDLNAGHFVTLTVNLSEAVTVKGTPTLTLNDGGTATYAGGTGTTALIFSYTVAAGQNTPDLTVTAVNLGTGTVTDAAGNAANLAGAVTNPTGALQIDTTAPTVSSVAASGSGIANGNGDLNAGHVVTLTVNLSEAVTVNGTPTLTLNDGGTATYSGGTGTKALTFSYTVAAGQNTPDLTVTAVNLGTATITDAAGNAANLSGAISNPTGTLQIDTTAPVVTSVTAPTGDFGAGVAITLTLNMSEAVKVANGTPTLTLNDGGTATYSGGSGTNVLTFKYTPATGQNTADLAVTAVNLNAATLTDLAGNAAVLSGAATSPAGTLQIDTVPPVVSSVVAPTGDFNAGKVITLTLDMSKVVTVSGGTPTLSLSDGGTANYVSGSGTNALVFTYTVLAGQNAADLTVTVFNHNSATITDAAGNNAVLSGAATNPAGTLQIDTTAPTVSSVVDSGAGINSGTGDLDAGKVVTLTLHMSEAVTVANGIPTLTLNDGGTAAYSSGSGSNTLIFTYTVASGQNTPDLTVMAVNLNSATVTDGAGNAAVLSGAITSPAGTLQIDTTAPVVTSVTAPTGDFGAGEAITLTLNMSEAVKVANGTPTLTLNDGGTATYSGGSGTNVLTFKYTPATGQNTADLAVTAVNLNAATLTDLAGNAAVLSGAATNPAGTLQIDTVPPVVSSVVAPTGDFNAGKVITLTLDMSKVVTVSGGTPTLSLSDGGTANYVSGSGTNALVFTYTALAGQNAADLTVTVFNHNSAIITDAAGNNAVLSGAVTNPAGILQIDTKAPTVSSVVDSGAGITSGTGDLDAGKTVTLTVNLSEAVTVAGGTPTLTLNDGGVATYSGGSGTNALSFSYTVASGQNTPDLTVMAVNLNSATVTDAAGNAANLAAAVTNPAGILQIDTTAPAAPAITSDIVKANDSVSLTGTAEANSTVTVYEGQTVLGAAKTQANGAWNFTTAPLAIGSQVFTATATDAAGNTSALSLPYDPIIGETTVIHGPGNAPAAIAANTVLEVNSPDSGSVTFAGNNGSLWLTQPSTFTGTVSDFGAQNSIDLSSVVFSAKSTLGYLPNSNGTGGTLSVTGGAAGANIALLGSYIASNFSLASDGHGGTTVYVDASQSANAALASNPLHA